MRKVKSIMSDKDSATKPAKVKKAKVLASAAPAANVITDNDLAVAEEGTSTAPVADTTLPVATEVKAPVADEDDGDESEHEEADDSDEVEVEEEDVRELVIIDNENCTNCMHFCETGTKNYNKCHFSKGNTNCPAKTTRIIIGIPIGITARAIARATLKGDFNRVAELTTALANKDPLLGKRVSKRVTQYMTDPVKREKLLARKKKVVQ